jgi:hypothetical protein
MRKFKVGDQVFISATAEIVKDCSGSIGTVILVNENKNSNYPYQVRFEKNLKLMGIGWTDFQLFSESELILVDDDFYKVEL